MEKRTLLAIAISMGIILLWWKIFPPPQPAPPPPASQPAATAPASGGNASAAAPGVPAGAAAAQGPEQLTTLKTPGAHYLLSSRGGVLREVLLTEERFLKDKKNPDSGLPMMGVTRQDIGSFALTVPKADFALPGGPWVVSQPDASSVVYRAENDQIAVEKRYRLSGSFALALDVVIENKTDRALNGNLAVHVYGRQDPANKGGGFFTGEGNISSMVCFVADSPERATVEELAKKPNEFSGQVNWVAADTKYFAVAVVPHPSLVGERRCGTRLIDGEHGEAYLALAPRTINAGAKDAYPFSLYAGPKYREALDAVKPGGFEPQLDKVVDVMLAVLSRPLLFLLKLFHGWVGNWGIAIIMLTFFVKLLTLYPTHRAMMSGKKMQRLAPKMQELRKKFENDRQRLGVETMNLYKQNGVSPLGGCLPSLITMPIWMALFSTLNYAVELYRAPFFLYIHDLSARDPYFITPLIMGGIMFAQMRMTPAGVDPAQQKMMTIMMPLMFTAFSLFLAAGLAIYTLTNSALSIVQQIVINRMDVKRHGPLT
ncbi:MAG TPA: membrane protein insertase YidC [Polyangia bacterium]